MYFYFTSYPYPKTEMFLRPYIEYAKEIYSELAKIYENISLIEQKNKEYDERLRQIEEGLLDMKGDISKIEKNNGGGLKIKFF